MVEKISAGSYDLNKWLFGGYELGVITMIAGGPGSGKTNFCILAACSQAKKEKKIIFIDTEGGFSSERVKQIVGEDYKTLLEKILLLEPKSFDEQKKIFQTLLNQVKKEHVGLIIVDSMAMLYRLELGDAIQVGEEENIRKVNREVANQMRILAEIARSEKISIIITNQVYKGFLSEEEWRAGKIAESNIVGGDLFKYWSKCVIELRLEGNKRKAVLLKHRSLPKKEMIFEIKNKGIFRKGWI
ncbi:MAG: DNA repair and recombination protein RadB [Nanoarchaeota archaeon]|nr:DNA repair and recombination protein RadB [Nanoarchaeota archaeon]MBU1027567.1 DNA repair and recombination protein RadB [Nanoarchaeota archaeon]